MVIYSEVIVVFHYLFPMPEMPPPGYRVFVEDHLPELRAVASRRTAGWPDAVELLCWQVLVDVAERWWLLELARTLLRRPGCAVWYVNWVFNRHLRRMEENQVSEPDLPEGLVVHLTEAAPEPSQLTGTKLNQSYSRENVASRVARIMPLERGPGTWMDLDVTVSWLRARQNQEFGRAMVQLGLAFLLPFTLVCAQYFPGPAAGR